ncbi:MAG: T9SS type A sorting domain-containing protein, partial [Bacteroidota bacterium]
ETGRGKMFQYSLTTGEFKFTKQFSGFEGQDIHFEYITDSLIWGYIGTSWEDVGSIFTIKHDGTEFTKIYNDTNLTTGQNPVDMLIVEDEIFVSFFRGGGIPYPDGNVTLYGGSVAKMDLNGNNFQTIVQGEVGVGTQPMALLNYNGKIYGTFQRDGYPNAPKLYSVEYDGSNFQILQHISPSNIGVGFATLVGDVIYGLTNRSIYSYDISEDEFAILEEFRNGAGFELISGLTFDNNSLFLGSRARDITSFDGVSRFDLPEVATQIRGLTLNSYCSDNPDSIRTWEVVNPNDFPVSLQWDLVGTEQSGTYEASSGSSFFNTPAIDGENKVKIIWMDEEDRPRRQQKLSIAGPCFVKGLILNSVCSDDPTISKRWEVINRNPFVVNITWDLVSEDPSGTFAATPGTSYFSTPTVSEVEMVKIVWIDEEGDPRRQQKLAIGEICSDDEFATKSTSTSREISANSLSEEISETIVTVYPNPFLDNISIKIDLQNDGNHTILMHDLFGRLVYEQKISSSHGQINAKIETDGMASGTYIVTINSEETGFRTTKRIVKK